MDNSKTFNERVDSKILDICESQVDQIAQLKSELATCKAHLVAATLERDMRKMAEASNQQLLRQLAECKEALAKAPDTVGVLLKANKALTLQVDEGKAKLSQMADDLVDALLRGAVGKTDKEVLCKALKTLLANHRRVSAKATDTFIRDALAAVGVAVSETGDVGNGE